MVAPNSTGIYLYAIIPTGDEIIFDVAGAGSDDNEVYTIPHRHPSVDSGRTLAALVSASPLPDYRRLKRNEAAVYLVAHQRVVETVMEEDFPLLPVKFGTVLADEAWVRRLLMQGELLFRSALERFAGKMQMEVVVLWDMQQVFHAIGQEEPIVQLKAQIAGRPAADTMGERVVVGQLVKASLDNRRAVLRDFLLPALREAALDLVVNPPMDDSMVINVALLVDKAGRQALERRLEALDTGFERGDQPISGGIPLRFRCVGPLPPYSFATIEVQVPSFEAVDEARRCLGLRETANASEIKWAYHRLAGQLHPDLNPDDSEAEARMAELTQAYELLTAYAESQALLSGSTPHLLCSFSRQAVERMLLISIRRQEALV